MGRTDAPPFARGETYYNGGTIDPNDPLGIGGVNLEGKEFVFEPNSQDQASGYPASSDPNGRPIRVKVVRNRSGINLKGGLIAHWDSGGTYTYGTNTVGPFNLETGVDGYTYQLADRPAGIIDEYLPPAGVVPWDLFYLVIDGPTKVTNQHAVPIVATPGLRLVPAATGTSYPITGGAATGRVDPLAGRVALQDLTGATATLGNNIQNCVGFADASTGSTPVADAQFSAIVDDPD